MNKTTTEKAYIKYCWDDPEEAPIHIVVAQDEPDGDMDLKKEMKQYDRENRGEPGVWYEYDVKRASDGEEELINPRLYKTIN